MILMVNEKNLDYPVNFKKICQSIKKYRTVGYKDREKI